MTPPDYSVLVRRAATINNYVTVIVVTAILSLLSGIGIAVWGILEAQGNKNPQGVVIFLCGLGGIVYAIAIYIAAAFIGLYASMAVAIKDCAQQLHRVNAAQSDTLQQFQWLNQRIAEMRNEQMQAK